MAGTQKHLGPRVAGAKPKPNPTSVPILVMPDGTVLNDSWAILHMALGGGAAGGEEQGTGGSGGGSGSGSGGGGAGPAGGESAAEGARASRGGGPNLVDVSDPDRIFYDAHLGPDSRQLA